MNKTEKRIFKDVWIRVVKEEGLYDDLHFDEMSINDKTVAEDPDRPFSF